MTSAIKQLQISGGQKEQRNSENGVKQWTTSSSAAYSTTIAINHRPYHYSQTEIFRKYIFFLTSTKSLPELQCGDIYIYLIENPSPYTSQKLKAYKSTDSYLIFRSGWVHNAVVWKVKTENIFIIRAKMSAI